MVDGSWRALYPLYLGFERWIPLAGFFADSLIYLLQRGRPGDLTRRRWKNLATEVSREFFGPPIDLVWGARWSNFGDALSPWIVATLARRRVLGVPGTSQRRFDGDVTPHSPRLLALGSILDRARSGDVIWGTGIREHAPATSQLDIRAVRGPLTRDRLLKAGIACPEVFGDPALLLPLFFRPYVAREAGRVGVIAHFFDRSGLSHLRGTSIDNIPVTLHPMKAIQRILACDVILSSSLHGIVVAHAYGIPAAWMLPANEKWLISEPEFKFIDYHEGIGVTARPYRFVDKVDVDAALALTRRPQDTSKTALSLFQSFPFLRGEVAELESFTFNSVLPQ